MPLPVRSVWAFHRTASAAVARSGDGRSTCCQRSRNGTPFPLQPPATRRSHTCFNRIDLPMYSNKKELEEYLTMAINMECTGFGIE